MTCKVVQSSDWAFILRTGTSLGYTRKRVTDHLLRFTAVYEQLTGPGVDEAWLAGTEAMDILFTEIDYRYWA